MTDIFAAIPREERDPASALYLTEMLVDIAERPNFLARLSGDEYRRVREVGLDITVPATGRSSPRAILMMVFM